jgi:hypothetical protein
MTPKYKRSRELVARRKLAKRCAKKLQTAMETFNSEANESEQQRVIDHAYALWGSAGLDLWWLCGGNSRNLSRALKTIADALDGKLHSKAAHLDDIYLSEWDKEDRKLRKGHKTYDVALSPSSGAWYDRVKQACKTKGISPPPTRFAAKRRLKQLLV